MSEPVNPALAFKAIDQQHPVFVRLRAAPERVMRVTAVDEARGRWVCCAYRLLPGTWQHDLLRPEDLELAE
jgi:hypothetical protein